MNWHIIKDEDGDLWLLSPSGYQYKVDADDLQQIKNDIKLLGED